MTRSSHLGAPCKTEWRALWRRFFHCLLPLHYPQTTTGGFEGDDTFRIKLLGCTCGRIFWRNT